ncbi:serpin-type proteinase inhibitor 18 [Vairimorpha necatrix]|uniref:Serpin-type proteinase inhibitor 18 n=1 Tax=Vairimorpha necatrix TaxID=6039 RepID=A0AAX4JEY0_9MICR
MDCKFYLNYLKMANLAISCLFGEKSYKKKHKKIKEKSCRTNDSTDGKYNEELESWLNSIAYREFVYTENELFSPLSIFNVVGMLFFGAEEETKTNFRMIMNTRDEKCITSLARFFKTYDKALLQNNYIHHLHGHRFDPIIIRKWINFPYKTSIKNYHDDFIHVINNDISEPLSSLGWNCFTKLPLKRSFMFVHTVTVKGSWINSFDAKLTTKEEFIVNKHTQKLPMMKQKGLFKYYETRKHRFLNMEVQNEGKKFFFVLILNKKSKKKLDYRYKDIKDGCEFVTSNYCNYHRVNLELPKFSIQKNHNLNYIINKMVKSDFMDKQLNLDTMFIKWHSTDFNCRSSAFISVNETGLSTGEVDNSMRCKEHHTNLKTIDFECNRPFVFYLFVKDDETIPILYGKYKGNPD